MSGAHTLVNLKLNEDSDDSSMNLSTLGVLNVNQPEITQNPIDYGSMNHADIQQ